MSKNIIKRLTPTPIRQLIWRIKARMQLRMNTQQSPKDIFTRIYTEHLWSSGERKERDFDSGPGSDDCFSIPYSQAVLRFAAEHRLSTIVDLGCGDFRVGQHIAQPGLRYIGVDVVEALVDRNMSLYGSKNVEFFCLDITADPLPVGELCLIREVFQHLSNAQIASVLRKLAQFRYSIVTEAQPSTLDSFRPNLNKPAGMYSSSFFKSGLRLDRAPFNVRNVELFLEVPAAQHTMRSFVVESASIQESQHALSQIAR